MSNSKLDRLQFLLEKKKFADSEWDNRGLIPSDSDLCEYMESRFNSCLSSLIILVKSDSSLKILNKELNKGLKSFERFKFDTEEREFICDIFYAISKEIEIDFKNELNIWLYGSFLAYILRISSFFKVKEKILEILSQNCTKCNSNLETFILARENTILDSDFLIVRCRSCREFNLIDNGSNVRQLRFGEYELVEQLPKSNYDLEGAKIRLKQLQFFRK